MKTDIINKHLLYNYINKLSKHEGSVELFLYNVFKKDPIIYDKKKVEAINAICRKIDILKNIYKDYDTSWIKRKSKKKIRKQAWVPLVSFLTFYLIYKFNNIELRFILLNSIFNAFEIMKKENINIPNFLKENTEIALIKAINYENY